jgi:FAD/FMN-containing dehydrogenase
VDLIREQIAAIVGKEHLVQGPEELAHYSGADNIRLAPSRSPIMAARPASAEELRDVLRVAAQNKLPVTPRSSRPVGFGGSIPAVPGLVLDLHRMNRIHSIDTVSRNAIIEPGVTFAQLQDQAAEKGLRALVPLELPASASVVSSYLDMAPLYAWPRYGTETILTMEVLLPSGETLKTGIAAIPMLDKPYFPFGTNPAYLNKVFFGAQGTLGIATKAVVKLKTNFEDKAVLFIPFTSIAESFGAIKELKRLDYAVEFFIANATALAALLSADSAELAARRVELPPFTAVLVLRGEREEVAYQKADIVDLGNRLKFTVMENLPGDALASAKLLQEIERPHGYERHQQLMGGYAVMPFTCMAAQLPMFGMVLGQMASAFKYDRARIGEILLPVEAGRFHFQYSFFFDPKNPAECGATRQLFEVHSSTLIKAGAFFSRPYGEWAPQVYAKASTYKTVLREIKSSIDPHGIMNPGKLDL